MSATARAWIVLLELTVAVGTDRGHRFTENECHRNNTGRTEAKSKPFEQESVYIEMQKIRSKTRRCIATGHTLVYIIYIYIYIVCVCVPFVTQGIHVEAHPSHHPLLYICSGSRA